MEEQTENKQEETGIKPLLEAIKKQNDELIEQKQVKKWKIPWKAKVSKSQASKGYATIQIIRNNGEQQFTRALVRDGIVDIDGFPRIATIDYKLTYQGKPYYIIPEWSMKPFSPVDNYAGTDKEKMNMAGRRLILARLVSDKINPVKKGFGGGWIWFLVAGAVAIYFFSQGGKIF